MQQSLKNSCSTPYSVGVNSECPPRGPRQTASGAIVTGYEALTECGRLMALLKNEFTHSVQSTDIYKRHCSLQKGVSTAPTKLVNVHRCVRRLITAIPSLFSPNPGPRPTADRLARSPHEEKDLTLEARLHIIRKWPLGRQTATNQKVKAGQRRKRTRGLAVGSWTYRRGRRPSKILRALGGCPHGEALRSTSTGEATILGRKPSCWVLEGSGFEDWILGFNCSLV